MDADWPVAVSAVYVVLVLAVFFLDFCLNRDRLSPIKFLCFFSLLDAFSLAWFAWLPELREVLVLSQLQIEHQSPSTLNGAYALGPIGFIAACVGIYLAGACGPGLRPLVVEKPNLGTSSKRPLVVWGIGYALGAGIFFAWVQSQGGLLSIWTELALAGQSVERSGYIDIAYTTLLTYSGMALYVELATRKQRWLAAGIVLLTCAIVGSLGNRAPILTFLILVAVAHNWRVSPLINVLSVRAGLALVLIASLMYGIVSLRPGNEEFLVGADASLTDRLSRDVVLRVGTLERRMVVVGHFDLPDIWLGQSYLGLLTGPIPSSQLRDKQPIDSGVYLKALADGQKVSAQMKPAALPETSWPEGNLAGFMNFHLPGYALLCALSGVLFGLSYRALLRSRGALIAVFVFASFAYFGGPTLSPFGIARVLMTLVPALLVGAFFGWLARVPSAGRSAGQAFAKAAM